MINWFDMPAEGLSNGGLFEVKELEVTENGTYETKGEMYNKVTVNVEGGGGSSDFSTAKVTVVSTNGRIISAGHIVTEDDDDYLMYGITEAGEYDVITYKGSALLTASIEAGETITVSGNAETSGSEIYITGDCTITIS